MRAPGALKLQSLISRHRTYGALRLKQWAGRREGHLYPIVRRDLHVLKTIALESMGVHDQDTMYEIPKEQYIYYKK